MSEEVLMFPGFLLKFFFKIIQVKAIFGIQSHLEGRYQDE